MQSRPFCSGRVINQTVWRGGASLGAGLGRGRGRSGGGATRGSFHPDSGAFCVSPVLVALRLPPSPRRWPRLWESPLLVTVLQPGSSLSPPCQGRSAEAGNSAVCFRVAFNFLRENVPHRSARLCSTTGNVSCCPANSTVPSPQDSASCLGRRSETSKVLARAARSPGMAAASLRDGSPAGGFHCLGGRRFFVSLFRHKRFLDPQGVSFAAA